jgi:plastocyanin
MRHDFPFHNAALCLIALFGVAVEPPVSAGTITVGVNGSPTPDTLILNAGDTVTWRLMESSTYQIESYGGEWKSPLITGIGATYSYTFVQPGDFTYRTRIFVGSLIVYGGAGQIVVKPWSNSPPAVTLNSPIEGAYFAAQAYMWLSASTTNETNVARVEFFEGTNLIAAVTNAPYQFFWKHVPSGQYALTARVTDLQGGVSVSEPVHIEVLALPFDVGLFWGVGFLPTGEFRMHYSTPNVPTWILQSSEDLINWDDRYAEPNSTWVDEEAGRVKQRFYRLLNQPG